MNTVAVGCPAGDRRHLYLDGVVATVRTGVVRVVDVSITEGLRLAGGVGVPTVCLSPLLRARPVRGSSSGDVRLVGLTV